MDFGAINRKVSLVVTCLCLIIPSISSAEARFYSGVTLMLRSITAKTGNNSNFFTKAMLEKSNRSIVPYIGYQNDSIWGLEAGYNINSYTTITLDGMRGRSFMSSLVNQDQVNVSTKIKGTYLALVGSCQLNNWEIEGRTILNFLRTDIKTNFSNVRFESKNSMLLGVSLGVQRDFGKNFAAKIRVQYDVLSKLKTKVYNEAASFRVYPFKNSVGIGFSLQFMM